MAYQRKRLSTQADVGEPGPLPANIANLSLEDLANLPASIGEAACVALGYLDTGFFYVEDPAQEPPPVRVIATRDFMRRLTPQELVGIETAAETDATIRVYLRLLYAGPTVNLDADEMLAALAYLIGQGLTTAERAAEIRA
jgi:hypothetical protein